MAAARTVGRQNRGSPSLGDAAGRLRGAFTHRRARPSQTAAEFSSRSRHAQLAVQYDVAICHWGWRPLHGLNGQMHRPMLMPDVAEYECECASRTNMNVGKQGAKHRSLPCSATNNRPPSFDAKCEGPLSGPKIHIWCELG